jgi:type IV pilus assembly protein PilN
VIRINLLPHRAEKRRARQIQFIALSVISVALAGLVVGAVQIAIDSQIS